MYCVNGCAADQRIRRTPCVDMQRLHIRWHPTQKANRV